MKLDNIVTALNNYIKDKISGFFILHKEVKPHPKFKAFKSIKLNLWYINKTEKHIVFTIDTTEKILEGQEEVLNNKFINLLLLRIYELIEKQEYLSL